MATSNFFSGEQALTVDLTNIPQVDPKPDAGSISEGYVVLDTSNQTFYKQVSGSWVELTALGGDMLKSVYDTGDDGRVDDAEQLNDGTNTVTAAQARTHIDDVAKHREINDAGSATTDLWSADKINTELATAGSGDMLKSTYDTDDNGIVDDAEQLNDTTNVVTAAQARTHIDDTTNPHSVTADQVGAVEPGDDADTLGSGAASDGQVLTADGSGGAAWEGVSGSGDMTKAVYDTDDNGVVDKAEGAVKTVYNGTASTITAGTLVEIDGSAGSVSTIREADKDTAVSTDGMTLEDISASTTGEMIVGGVAEDLNTSGMTAGGPLWLGDDGAFVDSAPTAGAIIRIGKVGVVAPSGGTIVLNLPAFPVLMREIQEDVETTGTSGTTHTIDCSTGTIHEITLTDNCTISFSNVPSDGFGITVILHQDGTGSRTVTWPASVEWAGGTALTLTTTANATDIIAMFTPDGGTTWYAGEFGLDFS